MKCSFHQVDREGERFACLDPKNWTFFKRMDYNQPNCKNYFNLNTNTFYYESPLGNLNDSESRSKAFNSESSFLESSPNQPDHSIQRPYCDHAGYPNLEDKEDFYVLNNRQFDTHPHHQAQLAAYPANLQVHHSSHYPPIHGSAAADQTEWTNSVLFASSPSNQLQTTAIQSFPNVQSGALQPLHHPVQSLQLPHAASNQLNQVSQTTSQVSAAQQTTKQLSVNLSMNMTMDIKSMDFKPTQTSSNPSDYDHVMNDVVSNVANKLVTNFNTNLLSPTAGSGQKDYSLYGQPQSYATKTHHQYPSIYNQNNSNYYNPRYHNSACYTNESTNHHLLNQYNGPFDELSQFKHFNHLQLNNNDCYELVSYNQNWSESNNSSSLTTLTSSSQASTNLGSLNSSFSNSSLTSNEINDNDYLINYSNNFLSSISVGSKSIGPVEPGEKELGSKRKLQQLANLTNTSYLPNSLEADHQKMYFKIENNEIRSSRDKQELSGILKARSNPQALHLPDRRAIDCYPYDKLDKKIKAIAGKNGNLCLLCGKSYARPSTLKTHLRTHSNERPFRCSICFKSFSQAANLTAHQRVHSGEKPFTCHVCYRKFSQSSSVTTHMRTHSGKVNFLRSEGFDLFKLNLLTETFLIHQNPGERPYR